MRAPRLAFQLARQLPDRAAHRASLGRPRRQPDCLRWPGGAEELTGQAFYLGINDNFGDSQTHAAFDGVVAGPVT